MDGDKMKIHFIGINGSGISGVALAAHKLGFKVSGCDPNTDTPYAWQLKDAGISVVAGHSADHIKDADLVVSSHALVLLADKIPEVSAAIESGKFMKWQEFLPKYIFDKKRLIAVSGTHGKTTTTSMVAKILETAGYDPTAFVGAIVPDWETSSRIGNSEWAVIEADEYANNFEHYRPEFIILNNMEMEHPEYFRDWDHYRQTFADFVKHGKVLIYNADDENVVELSKEFQGEKIPFSLKDVKIKSEQDGLIFSSPSSPSATLPPRGGRTRDLSSEALAKEGLFIPLLGRHNVSNAFAAATLARRIGISDEVIADALKNFRNAGHRLQKIFENDSIIVFDDYAHHHIQAKNTITAVREAMSDRFLIAIYEPHQISRWTQNTQETLNALSAADLAVVVDFWGGRESHLERPDVASEIKKFKTDNVKFIPDHGTAAQFAVDAAKNKKAVILVMGAGKSWKIAEEIAKKLS
jgi:UDP-N-acetylmuramate--alanine ligase